MEQKYSPDSETENRKKRNNGKKQNYDHIFRELDRQDKLNAAKNGTLLERLRAMEPECNFVCEKIDGQEKIDPNKPVIFLPDGTVQQATFSNVCKSLMPAIIFMIFFVAILIAHKYDKMISLVIFGALFVTLSLWMSFATAKKFRPRPVLFIGFVVGLAISYSAVAAIIYQKNPVFDMVLFQSRSVLGFGIGIALYAVITIIYDVFLIATCSTNVLATCIDVKTISKVNGKSIGTVTWEYKWDYNSYTSKTYDTVTDWIFKDDQMVLYINPNNPKRIRIKKFNTAWIWGIFFLIVAGLLIYASTKMI